MTPRIAMTIGLFAATASLCIAWIGPATWASAPRRAQSTGPLRPDQSERRLPISVMTLRQEIEKLSLEIETHRPLDLSLLSHHATDWDARLLRAEAWIARCAQDSEGSPSREELIWRGQRLFRDRSLPLPERIAGLKSWLEASEWAPLEEEAYAEIRDLIQMSDDPELGRHAPFLLETLGMDQSEQSRDLLKDLGLHAPSHRVREAAVRGLRSDMAEPATRATIEWIRDFDPSPRTRRAAAKALLEEGPINSVKK